jgi:hypothetical protein
MLSDDANQCSGEYGDFDSEEEDDDALFKDEEMSHGSLYTPSYFKQMEGNAQQFVDFTLIALSISE